MTPEIMAAIMSAGLLIALLVYIASIGLVNYVPQFIDASSIRKQRKSAENDYMNTNYSSPLAFHISKDMTCWARDDHWRAEEIAIREELQKIQLHHVDSDTNIDNLLRRFRLDTQTLSNIHERLEQVEFDDIEDVFNDDRLQQIEKIAKKYDWDTSHINESDYALLYEKYMSSIQKRSDDFAQKITDSIKTKQVHESKKNPEMNNTLHRAKTRAQHKMSALEELRTDDETDVSNFVDMETLVSRKA